ncbi:Wac protein [Fusarium oxysporum f. sp. albedinis]|nr:Wac protein [Fusarium oxysporum f. sp. albedinis]
MTDVTAQFAILMCPIVLKSGQTDRQKYGTVHAKEPTSSLIPSSPHSLFFLSFLRSFSYFRPFMFICARYFEAP